MRRAFLPLIVSLVIILPVLFLGVPDASAVITSWSYNAQAGFCSFAPGTVTASNPGSLNPLTVISPDPCQASAHIGTQLAKTLSWGTSTGSGQSALVLTEPVVGTVATNGAAAPDITITHQNRPITNFDPGALTTASLLGALTLTPVAPPGPPLSPFILQFFIPFKETLNQAPCVTGSTSVCDDIFVLLIPGTLANNFTGPDGQQYTLTLNVTGLGPLSADACAAAGVSSPCVGLLTPEGVDKAIPTSFTITSAVPEPSTLLLLGSGLAALSLYTRRKTKGTV